MPKVYEFRRPVWGVAFTRISDALHKFAPRHVTWTTFEECDISLVHVVGGAEEQIVQRSLEARKKLVIFQHCYLTARMDWEQYFNDCHLVVSYQDLTQFSKARYNFLRTPWGFDPDEFYRISLPRCHDIFTTGHIASTECIDKVWEACKQVQATLHHTGHDFGWSSNYSHHSYMADPLDFCRFLNQVQYVTCLRVVEGFEMLGVEALACGARPIVPRLPCYDWYEGHAYRICMSGDITGQVAQLLSEPPRPIGRDESAEITRRFAWNGIVPHVFEHILR